MKGLHANQTLIQKRLHLEELQRSMSQLDTEIRKAVMLQGSCGEEARQQEELLVTLASQLSGQ